MQDIVYGVDLQTEFWFDNFADSVGQIATNSNGICGKRNITISSPTLSNLTIVPGADPSVDPFTVNYTGNLTEDMIGTH